MIRTSSTFPVRPVVSLFGTGVLRPPINYEVRVSCPSKILNQNIAFRYVLVIQLRILPNSEARPRPPPRQLGASSGARGPRSKVVYYPDPSDVLVHCHG
jgi:hypothetical protein